ncbi:flavin reductase family protein [Treponema parvum]|uniref:Flavin reductase family protein n=1 Tax=Treponema parvum TaxID=138851 RepID=A0A975F658_9SPIR|nr:flavin reductase family protein [Treponema parvum]QTQ14679.1 flavin reductase family protein [Treponema parvum]
MRKNFGAKEYLYPMPVFIIATYDENGNPDAMNAAWGSIGDTAQFFACLSPEHKTVKNILLKKAFTVSMGTADYVTECDYVGIVSGNKVGDKLKRAGFHTVKSEFVDAPVIEELPMTLECKLISYDEKSCHLFGEIVNVSADERILSANGKIDVEKLSPISFDPVNKTYRKLGEIAGAAFKDGAKIK